MEMMSGVKLDVIWSPVHHDKFITWGPDITLYEVARIKDIEKKTTFVPISSTRGATVVASQSANGVRCVDISAMAEQPEPLLALGYASGRVALTTLKQTYDPLGLVGRDFTPRYPRLCNSVAWSHSETNMLAVAMEKHRSDHCILVWDVHKGLLPEEATDGTVSSTVDPLRPIAEMGLSETAHSVSWAPSSHRSLIASMNLKYIKIFDLRDLSNKGVVTTSSRYCYGAVGDPHNPWQVASRGDNVACVWDTRALHKPLLTLTHARPLAAVQWCPTRRNLLITLQKDSSSLRLFDIQQANCDSKNNNVTVNHIDAQLAAAAIEADVEEYPRGAEGGPTVLERSVSPCGPAAPLAAFSCHHTHEARLLALSAAGSIVEYTVCERVTVAWGGAGGLVWAAGAGALRTVPAHFYDTLGDISSVMKRRAQTDYGLKPELWQNADLADDDALSALWHFLALSRSLVEDGCVRGSPWRHPGVSGVWSAEEGYRSEAVPSLLADLPARRVTSYRSAERTRALQLCGWGWGWENAAAGVERAEAEGTPCRAAAIAAFHLRLRMALDVLARAREPQLRVVALALAGLSEERLWREALGAAASALPDPYLRALLHFLAASAPAQGAPAAGGPAPDLSAVLRETGMRLEDRVAFACIFLSDRRLADYLRATTDELVHQGDLSGILLTGISLEGVALLQRWVEARGDVQSAALVAARCCTPDLLRDPRVLHWLDSYRNILDSWQLWWARCALDAAAGGEAGGAGARLLSVACTYCGKSVAAPPARPHPRLAFARLPPPAAKMKQVSSCPNCRKPLPRCSVCTLHLGTGAGGAPFAAWFSWCLACRHGGHAHHLLAWFSEHAECPVSSCSCHCNSLDPPDRPPRLDPPADPARPLPADARPL